VKRYFQLLAGFVFFALAAGGQECALRLSGHVHSTATHENLPNATIVLEGIGPAKVTDANGDFRFEGLCAGTYTLLISHVNYDTVRQSVTLSRSQHLDIDLVPLENALQEVTITGGRVVPPGERKELSGEALQATRGGSLADALGRLTGVTLIQTGATIAKPVVHGLHSNRVLTINNGVRQEGQQWGNEHAPEIDPFIANRLVVVKGADELRYGSDAIGGVILVEPRPLRLSPGTNLEINAVYMTNNRQAVLSAIYEQQLRRQPFTYRLQGTVKRAANITTPNYRLNNTALSESNFSATAGWRKEHFQTELYYSLFHTRIGIFSGSHIGNLSDLRDAFNSPRPDPVFTGEQSYSIGRPSQEVTHHLLKSKSSFDVGRSRFNLLIAGQYNNRREFDVVRNAAAAGPQIDLGILTLTEELSWDQPRTGAFSGTVGFMAVQQDNSYSGRYLIPNYRSASYGVYAIERWSSGNWELQGGLRFDTKSINTTRLQTASQTFTRYQFRFNTLAGSLHAGYRVTPSWKANASLSLSTRAPHVNELLTNGIHHGSGTYEVGNIQLQPERSVYTSLSQQFSNKAKTVVIDLTLYRNHIRNFIFQQPRPNEPVLTIRGAFPKLEYLATDALLHGLDLTATFQLHERLAATSRYAGLRARNLRLDDWLIGMPSDRLSQQFSYAIPDGKRFTASTVSLEWMHVFRQTRFPDERNGPQDYIRPPAAYSLLHLEAATTVRWGKVPLTLGLTGRNLLNKAYREYLNSFRYFTDEMGRNIQLRLRIDLQPFY
jgi:iron complex outermembrane receptor protein